ncbi:hypothetical protein ROJ8625_03481 [Roseivivax jejudonensis]|uniref:Uncharacterized protein n=1 Tax=Roseivivax jejudonensis TaxID=1529041 RepID=A0A1X7A1Q2_9RHOB|nr:hypothetical protein ROJ8625_03481 [Roseivivax jejudonensis]
MFVGIISSVIVLGCIAAGYFIISDFVGKLEKKS